MNRGEKFEAIYKLLEGFGLEYFDAEYDYYELDASESDKEDHDEDIADMILKYALWIMEVAEAEDDE